MQDNFCTKTAAIWQFVGYGLYALKILVPIIIIAMGIFEFSKATISNDDKALNSALASIIKRLGIGIAIFFVPTIVSIAISLVSEAAGIEEKIEGCQTCLLRATSEDCQNEKELSSATLKQ